MFYAHASLYLEFPNDIAAKDGLIYISDNRAHCVHVFDYSMERVSTIGNESVTYYPIGVTLNWLGQVNNFLCNTLDSMYLCVYL